MDVPQPSTRWLGEALVTRPLSLFFGYTIQISLSYQQVGGADGVTTGNLSTVAVSVSSFSGTLLVLKCDKRPGMERVHLLHEEKPSPSSTQAAKDNRGGIFGALNK